MSSTLVPAAVEVTQITPFVARRPGSASPKESPEESPEEPPSDAPRVPRRAPPSRSLSDDFVSHFGILAPLLSDPRVTDVFVNGRAGTWVDRGDGPARAPGLSMNEEDLRALAVRLVSLGGRHIDEATPCVDTRLGDGIRVHAVLPPVSTTGTLLSLRLPSAHTASLDWLESTGFFDTVPRSAVDEIVSRRENVLITGAGGSGKTTFLSAMLGSAASSNRIIAIEDVAELRVDHPHFLALEARQANLEGAGAIGLDRLVREALRMRPDRLVLGECRGAEIRELLAALNTGHDGGAGTLHANSLADVPARIEALGALAGMSPEAVARQTVSAIGVVLHLARPNGGIQPGSELAPQSRGRGLAQMGRFEMDARGRLITVDLTAPAPSTERPRGAHAALAWEGP